MRDKPLQIARKVFGPRVELYECSTLLGLATVAAIIRRRSGESDAHRILVLSINSRYPEVENPFRANPLVLELANEVFDKVIFLNEHIFPIHPSHWTYSGSWVSHRSRWLALFDVGHIDCMYVESIQVPPALSLAQLFPEAEINVYSDGLMVYSPTRNDLPKRVKTRVRAVIYVEYLSGIVPLLLEEARPRYVPLMMEEIAPFFARLQDKTRAAAGAPCVIFLGQAMANAGMMSSEQELTIYREALQLIASQSSVERVIFKPHTSAPASMMRAVARQYERTTGAKLEVLAPNEPLEAVLARTNAAAIAGVFSTALFTASKLFDIPAFAFRTKDVLVALTPFENSNRIPIIAADTYLPSLYELSDSIEMDPSRRLPEICRDLAKSETGLREQFRDLQLVVGYHMQPKRLAPRRAEVEELLTNGNLPHLDIYLSHAKNLFGQQSSASGFPAPSKDETSNGVLDPRVRKYVGPAVVRATQWSAQRFLSKKKHRKLTRDPKRFFSDSQSRATRAFGRVYCSLVE